MRESICAMLCFFLVAVGCKLKTQNSDKVIKVKEINGYEGVSIDKVSQLLEERAAIHSINILNWDNYSYMPAVSFRIAHSNNEIWLKYYVEEKSIMATVADTNGAVHKDSCVEFFFDPLGDGNYYNFEFNCIGTTHLAFGGGRSDRQFLAPETIEASIRVQSSLGTQVFTERTADHSWEMTVVIPANTLSHNPGIKLKGLSAKGNFYKCGDATSEPHYLSWNPIKTENPDFHRPEFFGNLVFE
ncbi:hypothetical protein EHW67_06095 [Arenibacter aquaticus]|uniref:Carbohydrate-binding domain-containing protein n=1 Tax=Arenibacter aquaticus TaxID=2489054 RepID=A0A3S0B0E5_9FLAO|nr:hypothetical protein EHW67_06095 [Arenibacter aquaticus]